MAVVDPFIFKNLPKLLFEAAGTLSWAMNSAEGISDYQIWRDLIESLREYAIITESLPQND